jgi:hypothetical protein
MYSTINPKENKMLKKIINSIKQSFYQPLTIRDIKDNDNLGEIITNIIPRIGEDISVGLYIYKVKDVRYNLDLEWIRSVDILVEKN